MTSTHAPQTGKYAVKCDDCKIEIGRTDWVSISIAGGRCETCKG